jgi:prevent-host-death family protein
LKWRAAVAGWYEEADAFVFSPSASNKPDKTDQFARLLARGGVSLSSWFTTVQIHERRLKRPFRQLTRTAKSPNCLTGAAPNNVVAKSTLNSATLCYNSLMKLTRDIQSLSVFKRDTAKFMRQLKKTKEPIILTVNGKAEMVLLDAESYDYLREKDKREAIEGIRRGMEDVKAGRVRPAEDFFKEFFAKYNIPDK